MLTVASDGLEVNLVTWDVSRPLGVYVAVFAVCSVLVARPVFDDRRPVSRWLGLALMVVCIQLGALPGAPD